MKRVSFILGIAASLLAGTGAAQAGHCGSGFYLGIWPFVSFGFGVGVGAACSYPYPAYGCGSYGYAHSYSQHASASTAPSASNHAPTIAAAPVQEPPAWTPTTPAVGHWVPDPQPYTINPSATAIARTSTPAPPPGVSTGTSEVNRTPAGSPATTTVTLTKTPAGIPVYIVGSPGKGPNSLVIAR